EILKQEGYIDGFSRREEPPQGAIEITLKWHAGQPAIEGLRRVSRPGQRRYARCGDIPKVRNGLGIMIVSTSRGLMTDRAALKVGNVHGILIVRISRGPITYSADREAGVGGELICSIW